MSKKQAKQSKQAKNKKSFPWDNLAGIIAAVAVLFVILYVISTHINMPTIIVPGDAMEVTYPASIFGGAVEEMADSMRGSEGVYRVKVNDDGSLTVKMSPERYSNIMEAAENAVNSMTLMSISEETAIRDYYAVDNHTKLCFTVNKESETLEQEIADAVYTARLYHVCNNNLDVKIEAYYTDMETGETYLCQYYDINGNVLGTSEGSIVRPDPEPVKDMTE